MTEEPEATFDPPPRMMTRAAFIAGDDAPFAGPINDQDGNEVVAEGTSLTYEEAETMDYLVEGVSGDVG